METEERESPCPAFSSLLGTHQVGLSAEGVSFFPSRDAALMYFSVSKVGLPRIASIAGRLGPSPYVQPRLIHFYLAVCAAGLFHGPSWPQVNVSQLPWGSVPPALTSCLLVLLASFLELGCQSMLMWE